MKRKITPPANPKNEEWYGKNRVTYLICAKCRTVTKVEDTRFYVKLRYICDVCRLKARR